VNETSEVASRIKLPAGCLAMPEAIVAAVAAAASIGFSLSSWVKP
jgi:hypothetical protein